MGVKLAALSTVIEASREKSGEVGVPLKSCSMAGKVGMALGGGEGCITTVGLGMEVLDTC